MRIKITILIFLFSLSVVRAQQKTDANIFGDVQSHNEHIPFASIFLEKTQIGTSTDVTGHYMMVNLPTGEYIISANAVGYKKQSKRIVIEEGKTIEINFQLEEEVISVDEVVVTGTKTFKRKTESPVIVHVMDGAMFDKIEATTLSEGLAFTPGLRVETDCQTCNYTQLRMNGLGGGYAQILINSRPVFSPLTGLYGLEQIPSNMIERIEVVRGGGSALYGASAIGGTVNVITKLPSFNSFSVSSTQKIIDGSANDNSLNANASVVSTKRNSGMTLFASRRQREAYDNNGDNFSEAPELKNNSFGMTSFFKPTNNQKIEANFSSMYEYRYGGEIIDGPAHNALQSEERTHHVLMGGVDYQIDFEKSQFITYLAGQNTRRDHYTGIAPEEGEEGYINHYFNPPYGNTLNNTFQSGMQFNIKSDEFLGGENVFTLGAEYVYDDVFDEIVAYNYMIDQTTHTAGAFAQSDWEIRKGLTLLSGIRADKHNLVDQLIVNPRFSLLYRYKENTQFRASWATGFRPPQAFDADMHVAFANGGISRIVLADDLNEERSNSVSASVNYDKPTENYIIGFTLEGFYTKLNNAFILEELGEDEFGTLFEKRNGSGSTVKGATVELRGNYNRMIQIDLGMTLQSSFHHELVEHSFDLEKIDTYLRTPDTYGFYTLSYMPGGGFNATLSGTYTGEMLMIHYAGAPEQNTDAYKTSNPFNEVNFKASYTFDVRRMDIGIEISGGVKNVFNAYQNDFDSGKNRDSGYVYGPALPRTVFFGLKFMSL